MISYSEFAKSILLGEDLEDKFLDAPIKWDEWQSFEMPAKPGRSAKLSFSDQQVKFPKTTRFNEVDKRALAIHSFANHELLAMEMMATAILVYPHYDEDSIRFKKGILSALKDEQKHLKLYIERLNELGYAFGDFPLNDFFWRQMEKLKTPSQYSALMAMTFEAANLDFAQFYAEVFRSVGDEKSAAVMDIVLEDEISHVAFGAHWLKKWRNDKSLWQYYRDSLPYPLTPARSRGIGFDPVLHARAINDEDFIRNLIDYDDDFKVTKRSRP